MATCRVCGSLGHSLSVVSFSRDIFTGEDGPSQMALEDLAMFRAIPGSTVFYPSDAVSTEKAVELSANTRGICFIRSSRPAVPVIYANNEPFSIGKAKVRASVFNDCLCLVVKFVKTDMFVSVDSYVTHCILKGTLTLKNIPFQMNFCVKVLYRPQK